MKSTFNEVLNLSSDDLIVFVDDTGHECFGGNQKFYGLGGCMLLFVAYADIKTKWREVRAAINGNPDLPLHASTMRRETQNFQALSKFFLERSFARLAVTAVSTVQLPFGMHPCVPIVNQLINEIYLLASLYPCKSVRVIFESSERADPIVKKCFALLTPLETSLSIPLMKCLMPKNSKEAGLEVADFIVSAAGSQVQRRLRGQNGISRDFKDVFGRLPILGCRYRQISHVASGDNGLVKVSGSAFDGRLMRH